MEYHEALKELKRWETIKKRNGTNYVIEQYQNQYNEAVKRNENSDPNSIDKSNRIEYYMSMSEYTTLECVLRSLRKLKGE